MRRKKDWEASSITERNILTKELMRFKFGEAVASFPPEARFTMKALASRTGFAESTCLILFRQFTKQGWCHDSGALDDGRETGSQKLSERRGWEAFRDSMKGVFTEYAIDPEQEALLRLKQQGMVELDEEITDES